jgi:hypothetical protein
MKAIVSSDEWFPMADLTPETDEAFDRMVEWTSGGHWIIDVTPEELAEYQAICQKMETMSNMFMERLKGKQ